MSFKEEWREVEDIVNKSGHTYSVSNTGRVINNMTGRELSLRYNAHGYARANMANKDYRMHRVVAKHFIENTDPDKNTMVNHIDGNKKNNNYTNLEWCDQLHNVRHAWATGLRTNPEGELNGRSILKEEDVLLIWSTDMPVLDIVEKYGLTEGSATMVRNKMMWSYLKPKFYELYGEDIDKKNTLKRRELSVRAKSKFKDDEIKDIYRMTQELVPYKKIMEMYNISEGSIYEIKNKKTAVSQLILDGYFHEA